MDGRAILLVLLAGALNASAAPVRRVQYVMGTVCEITAHGDDAEDAVTQAFAEIARWDKVLSLYIKGSELSALNRSGGGWFSCSASLWEALAAAVAYAKSSKGAFDPTLSRLGYQKIKLDAKSRRARFGDPAIKLDFGGIGKGLALDHAAKILRERGVASAFINFGGQVYALGAPPRAKAWAVRIAATGETLFVRDASVSTSGNAENPGHIVSPLTGRRVMDDRSVTVVSPSAAAADAWSTALFVLGPAAAPLYDGCYLFSGSRVSRAAACREFLQAVNKGDNS